MKKWFFIFSSFRYGHYSEDEVFLKSIWRLEKEYETKGHRLNDSKEIECDKESDCEICLNGWLKLQLKNFILKYFKS